ncbi:hypothetical protein [Streptomyces chromofuscus]|uniref:Secreted protein n=1 Tax=Streptomyces chromofuscus TaxID=42881 RepID=A0A7M2TCM8_STRCW|nr:hypothetical protein [Streptomyces chromofuscus]QOV45081.1 hypothetical protein IPT68_03580 [Streptomyces chromofuscus]
MRTSQPLLGAAVTAAALPLALVAGPAAANSGISVSTSGSTVSVTTSACTQLNGSWGTASLLSSGQATFAQGRRVPVTGSSALQNAAWTNVTPGTYTVVVMCANGNTAGTQSVIVSAPSTPTISATTTPSPTRGVVGGVGGGSRDYGTLTLVAGGALVGTGVIAAAWYLRKRSKPYRL